MVSYHMSELKTPYHLTFYFLFLFLGGGEGGVAGDSICMSHDNLRYCYVVVCVKCKG